MSLLLRDHYHLAVTTTDANLSRAVQQLNGDYARWWNWRPRPDPDPLLDPLLRALQNRSVF